MKFKHTYGTHRDSIQKTVETAHLKALEDVKVLVAGLDVVNDD
jgi:hypothetical protein